MNKIKILSILSNCFSKREHQLLLHAISRRRKVAQRHEEVWILSTAPERMLHEQQTLKSYFSRDAILETKMIRSNVYASVCSQIVVSHLRDQSVRAFDREDVEKRSVAAFSNPSDLQRRKHRIALIQTSRYVACELRIERYRECMIATRKSSVVQPASKTRNLKSRCGVHDAAGRRGRVAGAGQGR